MDVRGQHSGSGDITGQNRLVYTQFFISDSEKKNGVGVGYDRASCGSGERLTYPNQIYEVY
jgi:hypothetical protein